MDHNSNPLNKCIKKVIFALEALSNQYNYRIKILKAPILSSVPLIRKRIA